MSTRSVAELCHDGNMSVEELSETTGLEPQRILASVLGRWTPSPVKRAAVAAALDVAVVDITWGHKTPIRHIYGQGPG